MAIDWDSVEEEMGGFKDYAPAGTYKTTILSVTHHEVGQNGSIAQDFILADTDRYALPKVTHWLSFRNDKWRQWHNKCLMEFLGADEESAKKAVEMCESKGNKDAIVKAYQATYTRLIQKHQEVEVEVWQDGKYSRGDFTDSRVRMSRPGDARNQDTGADIMSSGEEIVLDTDIPF